MSAYLSLIGKRRGGRLFEAGRLLTFSAFKMGAYSRWALIRGWALIRINTVSWEHQNYICPKVTKIGSIIGHRIDYNGVGALRGQPQIPSKN